jgi:hypothetical protein
MLTTTVLSGILDSVPDAWLTEERSPVSPADVRGAYLRYFVDRLVTPRPFVEGPTGGR